MNTDAESGIIYINGATLANIGTHTMTMTHTIDGVSATATFTVILKDPCKRAVFQTSPNPILPMTITMPSAGPTT